MDELILLKEALNGNILGFFGAVVAFLIIFFFVRSIITHIEIFFARRKVMKYPTCANALRVYRLYSRFGVGINNHPKDWAKVRNMFHAVNHSEEVPTELKEKLKARLIKKGLYINNVRVIDNYKDAGI